MLPTTGTVEAYSKLLINRISRGQKLAVRLTGVPFTEKLTRVENQSTEAITSEAVVPLKQQFHLTDFHLP